MSVLFHCIHADKWRESETEGERGKNGEVNRHAFIMFGCEGVVSNVVFKTCNTY